MEFSLAALVWVRRLRYPLLAAGLLLHLGIEVSMNIPIFEWVMVSAYVLFLRPEDLRRWLARREVKVDAGVARAAQDDVLLELALHPQARPGEIGEAAVDDPQRARR